MKHLKLFEEYNSSVYPEFLTDPKQIRKWLTGSEDPADKGDRFEEGKHYIIHEDGVLDIYMDVFADDWLEKEAREYGDEDDWFNDLDWYKWRIMGDGQSYDEERTIYIDTDRLVNGCLPVQIGEFSGILQNDTNSLYSFRGFPKKLVESEHGFVKFYLYDNPLTSDMYAPDLGSSHEMELGDESLLLKADQFGPVISIGEFFKRLDKYDTNRVFEIMKVEIPEIYNKIKNNYNIDSFLERQEKFGGQEEIDL